MNVNGSYIALPPSRAFQDAQGRSAPVREQTPEQRPNTSTSVEFDAESIVRRGSELAENRVQRIGDVDSAPLRTRQALDAYQQTQVATQAFTEGELVGVDLFV